MRMGISDVWPYTQRCHAWQAWAHAAHLGLVVQPPEHVRACIDARWGARVASTLGCVVRLRHERYPETLAACWGVLAHACATLGGFVAHFPGLILRALLA